MKKPTLTLTDLKEAAQELNVELAAIQAVAEVEAGGAGFLPDGQCKILFERHVFHRLTNGKFGKTHPHLSNPDAGGYKGGQAEHDKLAQAVKLDRAAALMSCSWGKFQLLGEGYKSFCGYNSIQEMVTAMYQSEQDQLWGWKNYMRNKRHVLPALRAKDWATFAKYYNGLNYKKNQYDVKLAKAYARYSK